ncbi:MAG: DUF2764 family protein [Verrucomicrobia bacterium]|nr:DUF2764 family protein [Verrucomicrobiota bacterium]
MRRSYYFVAISLPPLALRERVSFSFRELVARLEINLSKEDLEKTRVLRRFVDLGNIRALFLEEPIDPHGNLSEKELDEALLVHNILPAYVFEFLDQFEKVSDKVKHFSGLFARFFQEETVKQKGFLQSYLQFEREWRLVLLAMRAKQLGRDVARELQFEDLTDPFVAQILAQKDAPQYDPPSEYVDLKELVASCSRDPWLESKAFAEYRFRKVGEMAEGDLFSIDHILSYMAQLMLLEQLEALDPEKGKMILDTFTSGQ